MTTMETLTRSGFGVVGTVDRASAALVLAAQAPVTVAVIGPDLPDSADGRDLAGELLSKWGTPSVVLSDDADDWRGEGVLAARLGAVLADAAKA